MTGCHTVAAFATCDNLAVCSQRVYGLAFADPTCILIANNKGSATVASLQFVNAYDSESYGCYNPGCQ